MEKEERKKRKKVKKSVSGVECDGNRQAPDRVAYSETVKINIGDYEHREVFFSYSSAVREDETTDDAEKRVTRRVRKKLRAYEKKIRIQSREWTDFDTTAKNIV